MARALTPRFFASAAELRAWFERHHATATELVVGIHRKGTGRPSITWPESVDEALCFGWIDGIRRRHDATSYTVRFTPRRPASIWSAVNVAKAEALVRGGRMHPAGHAAFAKRRADRTGIYSFERRPAALPAKYARLFRKERAAWAYFRARPPGYRRLCTWWVVSAKREETRLRRLATLIAHSARGEPLPATSAYRSKE